jgi:3-oxoacyl-[acyl-carrier-protein] synthase II
MNDVVITGYSAVTPFGETIQDFAGKMMAGVSAVGSLNSLVNGDFPVKSAGLLPEGFYPPAGENRFAEEIETLLQATLSQLFSPPAQFVPVDGIVFGTNEGLARFKDIQSRSQNHNYSAEHLDPEFSMNIILSQLEQLGQPPLAPENRVICGGACTTGLTALHYAAQRIRAGANRRLLVLCAESRLRVEELLKLNALGALSRSPEPASEVSRPFSLSRSGFVRGEGAAAILIESRDTASSRGAAMHAAVMGTAVTSDAWRLTDGREDLASAARALNLALARARVRPDQIDYINAHGTATLKNDRIETEVIKQVFSKHARSIPISSLKSQIGHLNFASGLVEIVACLIMLQQQRIAPTINLHDPDPECDLDFVPHVSRPARLDRILKIGFGFGGSNAAVVLGRI